MLSLSSHLPFTGSPKPVRIPVHMAPQDKLTMGQLQREDCSLLDIKLPQHFPGTYSKLSLMKAITWKHMGSLIESNCCA